MQAAALRDAAERPAVDALSAALTWNPPNGPRTPLPEPAVLDAPVRTALRTRRSSFGRFSAWPALTPAELSALLAAAETGGQLDSDVEEPDGASLIRLYACVNHVESTAPGIYVYESRERSLSLVKSGAPGSFVQSAYQMDNYNVEQAAAVIVVTVRTDAVLGALGDRGYRLLAAAAGAAAQAVYTACAAAGLGCGAALGLDPPAYIAELDLARSGELPLLIMMVGRERPGSAAFRAEMGEPA